MPMVCNVINTEFSSAPGVSDTKTRIFSSSQKQKITIKSENTDIKSKDSINYFTNKKISTIIK